MHRRQKYRPPEVAQKREGRQSACDLQDGKRPSRSPIPDSTDPPSDVRLRPAARAPFDSNALSTSGTRPTPLPLESRPRTAANMAAMNTFEPIAEAEGGDGESEYGSDGGDESDDGDQGRL